MFKSLLILANVCAAAQAQQEMVAGGGYHMRNLAEKEDQLATPHQERERPAYMVEALGGIEKCGDRIIDLRRSHAEQDLERDGLFLNMDETVVILIQESKRSGYFWFLDTEVGKSCYRLEEIVA